MALFKQDAHFVVFMVGRSAEPTQELRGRAALTLVFANLYVYQATTHFNGQSTVTVNGDRAIGESYRLAHHLSVADGKRTLMVASIRYLDTFSKRDGQWLFAQRKPMVDRIETLPSAK
jgi:hypothetical protein